MTESSVKELIIPDQGDPDRKRALNVLAQRRYRQRRREKIQSLESRVRSSATITSSATSPSPQTSEQPTWESQDLPIQYQIQSLSSYASTPDDFQPLGSDVLVPESFQDSLTNGTPPSFFHASNYASDYNHNSMTSPPSTLSKTSSHHSQATATPISVDSELQSLETSQYTFSDDAHLKVPFFASVTASLAIANMLGRTTAMWDMTTLCTFHSSQIPTEIIPQCLIPTQAQMHIPHQAVIDVFPWPSVRTRIICVFAQPPHTRPLGAREPDSIIKLLYDVDDEVEGARVSGSDCYDERNWEVGQKLFENWWWAFDREVLENSNALRRKRGAPQLVLPAVAG